MPSPEINYRRDSPSPPPKKDYTTFKGFSNSDQDKKNEIILIDQYLSNKPFLAKSHLTYSDLDTIQSKIETEFRIKEIPRSSNWKEVIKDRIKI